MSDANVKLLQSLYDAFKRGDIPAIVAGLTQNVDWQVHGRPKDFPTIGRWRGRGGAQEFFRLVGENLEVVEFAPQEFSAVDDKVFVLGRYGWKVRKSGTHTASEWCHVFTIKDGKVSAFSSPTRRSSPRRIAGEYVARMSVSAWLLSRKSEKAYHPASASRLVSRRFWPSFVIG
jgi:ketosteroid isomerase-like protein